LGLTGDGIFKAETRRPPNPEPPNISKSELMVFPNPISISNMIINGIKVLIPVPSILRILILLGSLSIGL